MLTNLNPTDGAEAVSAFDKIYGRMDSALWRLSRHCRADLLAGTSSPRVEALVWTVKSWWGVQGVRTETKAQMAQALAQMQWTPDAFDGAVSDSQHPAIVAESLVTMLVDGTIGLGGARREFSLASKVLHWLAPWRVPVYDSFVRDQIGVPASWDHPQAYSSVARGVFKMVGECGGWPACWMGEIGPKSPLRALDKYLWWSAGGSQGTAALVKRPNDVLYKLGIDPSDGVEPQS